MNKREIEDWRLAYVLPANDRIRAIQDLLNAAHHTDLIVRVNGKDTRFQADWLKYALNFILDGQIEGPSNE